MEGSKNEEGSLANVHGGGTSSDGGTSNAKKLDRKPSLRRKFGALIRGSAELPAAINRGLQPIRRSLSFSKDLNRVYETQPASADRHHARTRSAQWYNSLGSLAENSKDEEDDSTHYTTNNNNNNIHNNNDNIFKNYDNNDNNSDINFGNNSEVDEDDEDDETFGRPKLGGRVVARTYSLMDKDFVSHFYFIFSSINSSLSFVFHHSEDLYVSLPKRIEKWCVFNIFFLFRFENYSVFSLYIPASI